MFAQAWIFRGAYPVATGEREGLMDGSVSCSYQGVAAAAVSALRMAHLIVMAKYDEYFSFPQVALCLSILFFRPKRIHRSIVENCLHPLDSI